MAAAAFLGGWTRRQSGSANKIGCPHGTSPNC